MTVSLLRSPRLVSFLADFSIAVVWIVSIFLLLISSSPILFFSFLGIVPRDSSVIGITVMFSALKIFIQFFAFFYFHSVTRWNSKIHLMTRSILLVSYN